MALPYPGTVRANAFSGPAPIALVDPEVVVLTGLIAQYPDLADRLLARIETVLPPENRRQVVLRRSTLGLQAWVRGAILVALQQLQPEVRGALAGHGERRAGRDQGTVAVAPPPSTAN